MMRRTDGADPVRTARTDALGGIPGPSGGAGAVGRIAFHVPGHPVAYTRVLRTSAHEPRARRYFAYREAVGYRAKEAGAVVWEGPIYLEVSARVKNRRFDADNLLKCVGDSLNGVCYRDDRQVTSARVRVFTAGGDEGVDVIVMRVT